jgi:uncharacterized protein
MMRDRPHQDPLSMSRAVNRRDVLKAIGLAGSAMALHGPLQLLYAAGTPHDSLSPQVTDQLSRRPLGTTGVDVSMLALGGSHLGKAGSEREAIRIVHEAIDAGLTFMDNAWEYHEGRSEEMDGPSARRPSPQGLPHDESLHARPEQARRDATIGTVASALTD